jgi:hypothetical protein
MEYTLLSPASMYPPAALTNTTVAARSTSGCCWSHSLCIYWDWGQLPSMLYYVFCDTLLIELSRERERERVIAWNIFLIRTWIKIFLVNIFITQLLRRWLVHVVPMWLLSRYLSMINIKSNTVPFQRGISHWWSNETVCSHYLNSVMTNYVSHLPEDRSKAYFHIICVVSIKSTQWTKSKVLYSRTHV